jgi:AmiR/NasT family two-component response regulator
MVHQRLMEPRTREDQMVRRVSVHAVTRQPLALALRDDVIRALHRENEALRRMLETRKLVERSQGLRMLRDGLSEPEAFRHIPKTSINTRPPMAEVARACCAPSKWFTLQTASGPRWPRSCRC